MATGTHPNKAPGKYLPCILQHIKGMAAHFLCFITQNVALAVDHAQLQDAKILHDAGYHPHVPWPLGLHQYNADMPQALHRTSTCTLSTGHLQKQVVCQFDGSFIC